MMPPPPAVLLLALPLCACAALQEAGREYVWHVLGKTPPQPVHMDKE